MRRILVADDDPHICVAIRAWLKRCGFSVSIADGGGNGPGWGGPAKGAGWGGPAKGPASVLSKGRLIARIRARLAAEKRAGSPTSWSGLVEVALTELLERTDLAETVSRYGLGLRRK